MTTYNNSIPLPSDLLSDSQQDFLNNFAQLDTSFGVDHYTYSNATVNNGKHNTVTTPIIVGAAHPVTSASEDKLYAMQDTANVGILQYSRGASNAVPTPITKIHSPSAGTSLASGATVGILNFTGMTRSIATLYYGSMTATIQAQDKFDQTFLWTGAALRIESQFPVLTTFSLVINGSTIELRNNTAGAINNIYYTLELHRMQ